MVIQTFRFRVFQLLGLAAMTLSKDVIVSIKSENKTQYHDADFANSE